jgi:hypothetical protein
MRAPKNWINFILAEGNQCAIVEAVNGSGGMAEGMQFKAFDFHKGFVAIFNQRGNAVWCHKKNLKVISKGTVL